MKKILIVEDDILTAFTIRQFLLQLPVEVCGVIATGEDAIQKTRELDPDIILMDIILDGQISGVDAAKEISLFSPASIIVISAISEKHKSELSRMDNCVGVLPKPLDFENLRNTIMHINWNIMNSAEQRFAEL